jgi:GDPmannose 4,6-dehydratase
VADASTKRSRDFVIATGETHTVRDFCEVVFTELGINIVWKGKDFEEKGLI